MSTMTASSSAGPKYPSRDTGHAEAGKSRPRGARARSRPIAWRRRSTRRLRAEERPRAGGCHRATRPPATGSDHPPAVTPRRPTFRRPPTDPARRHASCVSQSRPASSGNRGVRRRSRCEDAWARHASRRCATADCMVMRSNGQPAAPVALALPHRLPHAAVRVRRSQLTSESRRVGSCISIIEFQSFGPRAAATRDVDAALQILPAPANCRASSCQLLRAQLRQRRSSSSRLGNDRRRRRPAPDASRPGS